MAQGVPNAAWPDTMELHFTSTTTVLDTFHYKFTIEAYQVSNVETAAIRLDRRPEDVRLNMGKKEECIVRWHKT